jgi:phosphonate transport system ATP-binding protein
MLVVEGLTCRFGTKAAVLIMRRSRRARQLCRRDRPLRRRQIDAAADDQPPGRADLRADPVRRPDVTALRGKELRQWRARSAMIFQQFNLVGRLDVLTNVLMGRLASNPGLALPGAALAREDKALAMSALEQFDIASLAAQRADQLSGGQQQRVAIARALVQQPDIILADEPIASLDPRNTRIVMDALLRINKHFGITVLCNLHSLDLARTYCDRLIGMAAGRVVFDGAPAMLTDHIAARTLRSRSQ